MGMDQAQQKMLPQECSERVRWCGGFSEERFVEELYRFWMRVLRTFCGCSSGGGGGAGTCLSCLLHPSRVVKPHCRW